MRLTLDPSCIEDYSTFLKVKSMPKYTVIGRDVEFPDEYAGMLGIAAPSGIDGEYRPHRKCFDYQRDIARMAIKKKKFSVFADCGLGKTLIFLECAHHVHKLYPTRRILIVSPLMVIEQTIEEAKSFYGDDMMIQQVHANGLADWLQHGHGIGITNYEAITDDLPDTDLACIILDESSMLKHHYGAWGTRLIRMGRGVEYKFCLTGTPAPNDRIEYANHAVFMDAFPTVNSFLARFFVNRGQTSERWELKKHSLAAFYTALSHWCIFLTNPATYGWKDNCGTLPPINVHVHDVRLTRAQRDAFQTSEGALFMDNAGGIGSRGRIARIGKGFHNGEKIDSLKTKYIVDLIESWPDESTIIWCKYNAEQEEMAKAFPDFGNIDGSTPSDVRRRIIHDFKSGIIRGIITKPKILGFGLNLQRATRQVFSGLQDSYEEFYQAVKRSNRVGSTKPLNVHIPVTELEAPMVQTVLSKASRVQKDTEEQEKIFHGHSFFR